MKTIEITVKDKIATNTNDVQYVCGNSDYVVDFIFDSEWDGFGTKTARFSYSGTYQDQIFTGTRCPVPVIYEAAYVKVGIFAGNMHTTTPALFPAKKSIICGAGVPADPAPDVYAQIMSIIDELAEDSAGCRTDADNAAASAASAEAAINDFKQVAAEMDAAVVEAEQHAQVAQECAQAMAGTFDFTGYLRYQIVDAAPETFDEGVLYIVTTA